MSKLRCLLFVLALSVFPLGCEKRYVYVPIPEKEVLGATLLSLGVAEAETDFHRAISAMDMLEGAANRSGTEYLVWRSLPNWVAGDEDLPWDSPLLASIRESRVVVMQVGRKVLIEREEAFDRANWITVAEAKSFIKERALVD